tara:strand:- start:1820 stop:1984 length:165 start_codon:yes stop_codon:yes gene_type:complete
MHLISAISLFTYRQSPGFWGQTIAGLVSFTSLFMLWTGFALAYRRLVKPLFRKS